MPSITLHDLAPHCPSDFLFSSTPSIKLLQQHWWPCCLFIPKGFMFTLPLPGIFFPNPCINTTLHFIQALDQISSFHWALSCPFFPVPFSKVTFHFNTDHYLCSLNNLMPEQRGAGTLCLLGLSLITLCWVTLIHRPWFSTYLIVC